MLSPLSDGAAGSKGILEEKKKSNRRVERRSAKYERGRRGVGGRVAKEAHALQIQKKESPSRDEDDDVEHYGERGERDRHHFFD